MTGLALLFLITAAIIFIIFSCSIWKWHPFVSLLVAALITGIFSGIPLSDMPKIMAEGFGNMMTHIGIVVILGTLIGTVLEKTGATQVIANSILLVVGKDRPVMAITLIGLVVGIPIFCDSGYVILSGLTKPLAKESKKSYAAIVAGLSSGLYITHTLLPPHPGSLAGAGNLGLSNNLGIIILIGLMISFPVAIVTWWWSDKKISKVVLSDEAIVSFNSADENVNNTQLPSLSASIIPIIVPVLLIALGSASSIFSINQSLSKYFNFVGSPIIALSVGLALSMFLLASDRSQDKQKWFKEGIEHAGPILILVGAGGVFGSVLKKTSLATWIGEVIGTEGNLSPLAFMLIAYLLGVLLKTAQGSTTSAIIVVTSILSPIAPIIGFDTPVELTFLLCSIASGCMMVSHANDAYFWVISQFSGLTMTDTYKVFSVTTVVLSLATFLFTLVGFVISQIV
jgi:gluconate:H+ symporter, GntP family